MNLRTLFKQAGVAAVLTAAALVGTPAGATVEVAAPKALGQSVVSSHLLQDTFSDHIHTVSVELLTPPQLLRLTASTPLGSFLLR